jgi:hypothetical protein
VFEAAVNDEEMAAEEVAAAEAAAEADYQKSQRAIRQVEAEEVGRFKDILAEWGGSCGVCKIERADEVYHEMEACPRKERVGHSDGLGGNDNEETIYSIFGMFQLRIAAGYLRRVGGIK